MSSEKPIFLQLGASDEALAEEVALKAGFPLPHDCVAGVAANARLLQHHINIFRRAGR
jgi:hypothetical protein